MALCESQSLSGYGYFFFDSRNADQGHIIFESFLRSLLSQMSYRCGGIPAALQKLFHAHGDGRAQPSLESLSDTLKSVIEGFDHFYIMVDSLDECGERPELLRWLETVASWNLSNLHLLVTTRPEPDIQSKLDVISRISSVRMNSGSQKDIMLYLNEQLQSIAWDERTRHLVMTTLGGRADGMCACHYSSTYSAKLTFDLGFDGWRCKYWI